MRDLRRARADADRSRRSCSPAFAPFQERVARAGLVNSLSQVVLKIASPGVPDFYQGTELWDLSLVDPDNRRPVDFAARRAALDRVDRILALDAERAGRGRAAAARLAGRRDQTAADRRRPSPAPRAHGDLSRRATTCRSRPSTTAVPAHVLAFARSAPTGAVDRHRAASRRALPRRRSSPAAQRHVEDLARDAAEVARRP